MFADPDGHTWEIAWIEALQRNDDGTVALPVMTWDELRDCVPGAARARSRRSPSDPACSVFKAPNGKMFAVSVDVVASRSTSASSATRSSAESLRRDHEAIVEGYHLNKRHWITVTLNADVPDAHGPAS